MLDKEFDSSEMLDKEFDGSEMLDKEFDSSKNLYFIMLKREVDGSILNRNFDGVIPFP